MARSNKTLTPKQEAIALMAYSKKIKGVGAQALVVMLRGMLDKKKPSEIETWNWDLAEQIESVAHAILVIEDADADFDVGDSGEPVVSGKSWPSDYEVLDRDHLTLLLQMAEDAFYKIPTSIKKFLTHPNQPRWLCYSCGHFMGEELHTYEVIRGFILAFDIGHYRKCRSCKKMNYFEISGAGVIKFYVQNP